MLVKLSDLHAAALRSLPRGDSGRNRRQGLGVRMKSSLSSKSASTREVEVSAASVTARDVPIGPRPGVVRLRFSPLKISTRVVRRARNRAPEVNRPRDSTCSRATSILRAYRRALKRSCEAEKRKPRL